MPKDVTEMGKCEKCGREWKEAEVCVQDRVSEDYEEKRYLLPHSRCYHTRWTQRMVEMLSPKAVEGRILDNGCGNGILGFVYPEMKERITGLDISPMMIEKAKLRLGEALVGDSENLPFEDGTFSAVVARSLLHHLPDPRRGIDEMARVLAPGGEMVIADTNKSVLSELPRKIANHGEHFSDDHRNMNANELVREISRKFEVKNVEFFGYIAYPLCGFPDLIDFSKYLPITPDVTEKLVDFDRLIGKIPGLRRLGWGMFVHGVKRD